MGRSRVATATAWGTVLLASFVLAVSPPIDDFWLALASAHAIRDGADAFHAIPLAWMPQLPGALNPQWGAQLLLGGAGSLGVALVLCAALAAGGLLITARRTRATASLTATAVAMLLVVAVLAPHLIVRPQAFSILLFPLLLLLLDRGRGAWWLAPAAGLLIAAWANLHGAFVVGQLAVAAYLVGALVRRAGLLIMAMTAVGALLAPLANPVGAQLLAYAYGQGTSDVVRAISVEWQPAWPWNAVALLFWVLVVIIAAARVVRRGAISAEEFLLLAGLALLAITGIRHIPWFVLGSAPIIARDIDAALAARPRLASAVGTVRGPLATRPALWIGLVTALVVGWQFMRPAVPAPIGRLTQDAPAALADVLEGRLEPGESARLINEQTWGGYLAYRLEDRATIAMDGRLEIRDADTWQRWFDLMNGGGDPVDNVAAANVRWAVLADRRTTLIGELRTADWTVIATGDGGVLLRAP